MFKIENPIQNIFDRRKNKCLWTNYIYFNQTKMETQAFLIPKQFRTEITSQQNLKTTTSGNAKILDHIEIYFCLRKRNCGPINDVAKFDLTNRKPPPKYF